VRGTENDRGDVKYSDYATCLGALYTCIEVITVLAGYFYSVCIMREKCIKRFLILE